MTKYVVELYISGAWVEFNPSLEDCSIVSKIESGFIFPRTELRGELTFFDSEFSTLFIQSASVNYLDIIVSYDGDVIYRGFLDLLGKYNVEEQVCELSVFRNDEYKSILDNLGTEYSLNIDNALLYSKFIRFTDLDNVSVYGFRKLESVIEYIIKQINSSILFDSDSWLPLDTATSWRKIYVASHADAMFEIADARPLEDVKISLEKIFSFFKMANIYWELELVGNNYYFRLKHISDVTKVAGVGAVYNLIIYKGNNWVKNSYNFKWLQDVRFYRKSRKIIAGSRDFVGSDILIPSLERVQTVFEEDYNIFTNDIEDIYTNRSNDKYPKGSDGVFIMCVADDYTYPTTYDILTKSEGSGIDISGVPGGNITFTNVLDSTAIMSRLFSSQSQISSLKTTLKFTILDVSGMPSAIIIKCNGAYPLDGYDITTPGSYELDFYSYEHNTNQVYDVYITGVIGNSFNLKGDLPGDNLIELKWMEGIKNTPILGTASAYNMDLSLSYIDDNFGAFDLPDTPAIINGVSTAVAVRKQRELIDINFPLNNPLDVDIMKLFTTDFGDIEPTEISIPLNYGMAKLKALL